VCDAPLCLSLGYGFAPAADDKTQALFIHLGMSSNIDPATFHRTPLQVALVIDRSGSMEGRNMEGVKRALRALVGRLTPQDEIAIVAFDSEAELLLPAMRVSDTARILAAIDSITPDGATNIEAGLKIGADQLGALEKRSGYSRRIILFTDALPNAGTTDTAGFRAITARYADEGIGLTVFGVGVEFGQELVYHITRLRGANFFYLDTPEKGEKLITEEFDYMVTPLVYDLKVRIATPKGMRLRAVYGLPSWTPGDRDAELFIPTVFLSSNRGAIILRYERDGAGDLAIEPGALLATGNLGYTEPAGRRHDEKQELRHRGVVRMDAGTQFYTHDGMRKAVALTNIYFGLRDGCVLNTAGRKKEALEVITRARSLALVENITLADPGIEAEIALLDKLALNIKGE
jgi:Ca-activated chloride channel family protein